MKCLIIVIRFQQLLDDDPKAGKANFNYNIPIGLAYISAFLKQNGHEVQFLNLNHCDGIVEELIKDRFSKESYDFVITGGISPFYPDVKNCVDSVRRCSPSTRIILGGGLISSQPEIMFNLLQPDYGVIGEGELTIKELFECLENKEDINTVNGLIFRNTDGQIILTKPRDSINNLDLLPWPDYEGLGFDEYLDHMLPSDDELLDVFDNPRIYPMISSRSCPFACTFCYHPLGNKYRQRSVSNIIEEIKYVVIKYKINIIHFYDELFAQNKDRLSDLCKDIKEFSSTIPWELKWVCQSRVDFLDENVVREMKDAGCYFFGMGLESYSATVLKSMKKNITPNQIDNALHICKRVGISVLGNFIFGDIAETKETYRETLRYWKDNQDLIGGSISLGHVFLYQGSHIYKHAVKKGIIKDEIQFIEERAKHDYLNFPINFTDGMTDEEYQQMTEDIWEANVPKYYAIPLVNIQTKDIHEIHVRCPFCKEITVYKNYHISPDFARKGICCRKCRSRFIMPGKKLRLKLFAIHLFGFRTLYHVSHWIYDLSDHLPFNMKIKIKKILQND